MQRATTYREQSRIFLAQAHEELAKGDLQQAAEKGWGAAAQMLKAIAQRRGLYHRSHRSLQQVINELHDETKDSEWTSLFAVAESLHMNFYENWSTKSVITLRLLQVKWFVEKAEKFLGSMR